MPAIFLNTGSGPGRLLSLRFISFLIFSLVEIQAFGQTANPDVSAGLRLNEVNSHAARHFLNHYAAASGVRWIRDDQFYIACFNSDHSRTRVHYTNDGHFSFCTIYYREDGLDGNLKSAIVKKFPGCQILTVTELTDDLYKKAFFVNIKNGRHLETLRCDSEGIEVTEDIKDAGI